MNFSDTGYTPRTVIEIRDAIAARMKAAFGENFDVTTSSPDGQVIGIMAQEIWEVEQEAFALFQSLSPSLSSNVALDYSVGYNDLKRIVDRPCTVMLTLRGIEGTLVPKGSRVSTRAALGTPIEFTTNLDVLLPNTVLATCTTLGDINVNAGEVTEIVTTGISGWVSVINEEDGSRGIPYESDGQLRARQVKTVEAQGRQSVGTIQAALTRLGVEYLSVLESYPGHEIPDMPLNSFEVVVKGGEPNQIAEIINAERPLGIRAYGNTEIRVIDSLGQPRIIGFTRPEPVAIYVEVYATKKVGASNDAEAQIKANLVNYIKSLTVGEDVEWAKLFAPISGIPNITIDALLVGLDGLMMDSVTIPIDGRQYATCAIENISVKSAAKP